ncbi:DctP family TRAP transporter solute-binding subunit [Angustibacter sp. Root456]|uniref:DctP family TRAP transporter solute-binding subunit n=1 Tax=Angustibacter sp. Root456 TaxID=1736539 RepID=UPI0006FFD547|nr:DctP family TRAP transporter solute-binding subunit [Angustibacter sp. Root456]KQX61878.1 hypothetical protein ASD06_15125 [Angustibacter sp. Root456]
MKLTVTRPAAAVAAATLCLVLGACSQLQSAATGKSEGDGPRQLLLGHGAAPGNPRTVAADAFAQEVKDKTSGRITVQVQGSEQLGSDTQMLQSVRAGTLDLSANSQGPLSASVPEAALIGLPFLFDDSETAYKVLDGPVGDQLAALAEKQGIKVLAWWDNGIRNITNNKRPITSPKDVAGLKIRTPDDPMTVDIFKALGANPTPLAFGELYLALRQGTVDGQENPLTNIASAKLNEVQKYLAMTGHKYESTPFVMSLKTWNSLSAKDQKVVQQAADDARDKQRRLMQEQDKQLQTELAKTMKITTPDKEPFRQATASVYDTWSKKYPELVKALQDAAQG